jgi:hypothetical protein
MGIDNLTKTWETPATAHDRSTQSVRLAQVMFYITGAIWVVFGSASILTLLGNQEDPARLLWMIAILMFGNAGLLIWVGRRLARMSRMSYLLALLVLGVNILLTVTDQFRIIDAVMLAFNAGLFLLLITWRSKFLH